MLASKLANLAAPIDSPSTAIDAPEEVEGEAQCVLAAAQASQGAAVALDGRMIDTPVILRAQAVLRERRGVAGG